MGRVGVGRGSSKSWALLRGLAHCLKKGEDWGRYKELKSHPRPGLELSLGQGGEEVKARPPARAGRAGGREERETTGPGTQHSGPNHGAVHSVFRSA